MYSPGTDNDVIVQVTTAPRHRGRDTSEQAGIQLYDAVLYSRLDLRVPPPTSSRYPEKLRNLPLRGIERLVIRSRSHGEWLASFIEGEKGMPMMRERLLSSMSPGLCHLLTDAPLAMRLWWNTTPELADFPWELTVHAGRRDGAHRVAFIRGLPPQTPIPTLPLAGAPKLGMIGAFSLWPGWAHDVRAKMGDAAVPFDGPLRSALRKAISAGVEFIHAFTDGVVSGALEGILYDHAIDRERAEMSAGELSKTLSGSRVVVLALSSSQYGNPDVVQIAGRSVLSAYRAFAYIGSSPQPLPTIVASLGPVPDRMMAAFWSVFYDELGATWHLTESLRRAQAKFPFSCPIALFSRHAGGKLFEQAAGASEEQPMQVRSELLQSEELTLALSRIGEKYGVELPSTVKSLFEKETARQSELRGTLDQWINPSEEA